MDQLGAAIALKALDGLDLRASVTAQNIANAGTSNYRPIRAAFEDALREAAVEGPAAVANVQPAVSSDRPAGGSAQVRVDLELETASATALRYSALVEVLGRQMELESVAITGNS